MDFGILGFLGLGSGLLKRPGLDSGLLGLPGLDSGILGILASNTKLLQDAKVQPKSALDPCPSSQTVFNKFCFSRKDRTV